MRRPLTRRWSVGALLTVTLLAGSTSALGNFGTPVDLSATGRSAYAPQIAFGPDGAATAVWARNDGANNIVQAATRPAGSATFGTPADLSATGQTAAGPQIAIGPDGAATVVWRRNNGANDIIQAATRPAGSATFGTPADLSAAGQTAAGPQIAIGPDGAATVVWFRNNGANYIVQAASLPAGSATFGTPVDLSATGRTASNPQIAIGPDGAATVVWSRNNGANNIIQAATRPAGSATFGTPVDLSATGQSASSPQITIGPDGAATVVWYRNNGANDIIQAATRPTGSATFGTPVDLSATGGDASDPQIAIGPDGVATAVWNRDNGANGIIQAATRPAGSATFGTPVDLSATGPTTAYNPQIAISPDGAATAVWTRYDGSNDIIQAASRPAGSATFGTPVDLSATGGDAYGPQIAVGPDGAATVVWRRNNGASHIIQAATSPAYLSRLTVTRGGAGSGSVSSAPSGIDCGATCSWAFPTGSSVTLTAQPAAGSVFSSWGGDCSGTSPTCTVTLAQAASVSATFAAGSPTPATANETTTPADAATSTPSTATAAVQGFSAGAIRTKVTATGAGAAVVTGTSGGRVACATTRTFTTSGSAVTSCVPRAWVQRRRINGPVKVAMNLAFTPSGGATTRTTLRTVILPKITEHTTSVTG